MTTMRFEAEATIFSRNSAPPPPLIRSELGIDFVGPVDRQIEFRNVVQCSERNAERLRLRIRGL